MLKICLVFWESEPQYTYKRYAYKKICIAFDDVAFSRIGIFTHLCYLSHSNSDNSSTWFVANSYMCEDQIIWVLIYLTIPPQHPVGVLNQGCCPHSMIHL